MSVLKSMTGYGSQKVKLDDTTNLIIELRSLNSKNLDLDTKLPSLLRPYEMEGRKMIAAKNKRGKIVCYAQLELQENASQAASINEETVNDYWSQIKNIAFLKDADESAILSKILDMPGALNANTTSADYSKEFKEAMDLAIEKLDAFKIQEGKSIHAHLSKCVQAIADQLDAVIALIPARKEAVTKKIKAAIDALKVEVDETRYYQELTYYFEKIDISEEVSRLSQHLHYFLSCLDKEPFGKKLGFIGQEIGREINTIGSKAQNADMQKIVVNMKDNLEQIKEQVFNVE